MTVNPPNPPKPEGLFIYRPWRRDPRTGALLWARNYGLRAWRIPVSSPSNGPSPSTT